MTTMRGWTTDELLDGLQSAEIYTRCRAAYELGRRRDMQRLKVILVLELKTAHSDLPDPYIAEKEQLQRERRRGLLAQTYAAPEVLLQVIFEHGDENMRCLTLCAAAGLGKAGHALLQHISKTYQWTRDAYLVLALEICQPEQMQLFIEYIYAKLAASRWSTGFITLLYRRGGFGIHTLGLALSSGDTARQQNIINGLEYCQGWAQHDHLVYGVIQCLHDDDLTVAKSAIKLLRHARVAQAVPYLSPFLRHKTLGKTAFGALRIIDTAEARQAIEGWQKP